MPRGRLWTPAEDRLVREAAAQNRQHGITSSGQHENRLMAVAVRIGRTWPAHIQRLDVSSDWAVPALRLYRTLPWGLGFLIPAPGLCSAR